MLSPCANLFGLKTRGDQRRLQPCRAGALEPWVACRGILYYTILYYTILYYTILYYTILYYTILYYTIPNTILYYTID